MQSLRRTIWRRTPRSAAQLKNAGKRPVSANPARVVLGFAA